MKKGKSLIIFVISLMMMLSMATAVNAASKVKIVFDPNGAEFTDEFSHLVNEKGQIVMEDYKGEEVDVPQLKDREHFTFVRWCTQKNGSTPNQSNKIEKGVAKYTIPNQTGKTFYAYSEEDKNLWLDWNDGSDKEEKIYALEDGKFYLPTPIRDGYNFIGWFKKADDPFDTRPQTNPYNGTQKRLYARWEEKPAMELTQYSYNPISQSTPINYKKTTDGVTIELAKEPYRDMDNAAGLHYAYVLEFNVIIEQGTHNININLQNALNEAEKELKKFMHNNSLQPSDDLTYKLNFINNTDYSYRLSKAEIGTDSLFEEGTGSITGFEGYKIPERVTYNGQPYNYTCDRVLNRPLQNLGLALNQIKDDSIIGKKLRGLGYGDETLSDAEITQKHLGNYYLDFYNADAKRTEENRYKSFEDLSDAQLGELFDKDYSGMIETCKDVAEMGYWAFFDRILKIESGHSIKKFMDNPQLFHDTYFFDTLENGETKSATIKTTIDGKLARNAYQNFLYTIGMQFELDTTFYTVEHQYYTSTDGGEYVLDGTVLGEEVNGLVGDVIEIANIERILTYEDNTYEYHQDNGNLTLVLDPETNKIIIEYRRDVRTPTSYTVEHQYYTSTDGGEYKLDGTALVDAVEGLVGDKIRVEDIEKILTFGEGTYELYNGGEDIILVVDEEANMIIIEYRRDVTTPDEDDVLGDKEEPETPVVETPKEESKQEDEVLGDVEKPDTSDMNAINILAVTLIVGAVGIISLRKRKEL